MTGHISSILLRQKSADLTHSHTTRVHGNDLVIKTCKAALILAALAVALAARILRAR